MISINYNNCTHKELITIIREAQKELNSRGTITHCIHVAYTGKQKTIYMDYMNSVQKKGK